MSQDNYCRDFVHRNDPDRFLLSLFAPRECREALWALFAFNQEIAKTREVVSETQLGLIRLQWWREEITRIYETGEAREHEILMALEAAIKRHNLSQEYFEALIYGREFDLEGLLPETEEGTMKYIEHTNVPLMQLAAQIVGENPNSPEIRQIAINYGLIGLLRAVPFHAAQERCYLPADLLQKHQINEYELYKGKNTDKIAQITEKLANNFDKTPKNSSKFIKSTQNLTEIYKSHLKKHNFDPFKVMNAPPPAFKEFRLFLRSCI